MGYHTCLSGKMHFVGADQLHDFENRVTTGVYPSDFSWTTDWSLGPTHWAPRYHSMRAVLDAGPWRRSVNTSYDEEVAGEACRWLHDHADRGSGEPFFLAASFISPHAPYLAPPNHWELYTDDEIDDPKAGDGRIPELFAPIDGRSLAGPAGSAPAARPGHCRRSALFPAPREPQSEVACRGENRFKVISREESLDLAASRLEPTRISRTGPAGETPGGRPRRPPAGSRSDDSVHVSRESNHVIP